LGSNILVLCTIATVRVLMRGKKEGKIAYWSNKFFAVQKPYDKTEDEGRAQRS